MDPVENTDSRDHWGLKVYNDVSFATKNSSITETLDL